MIQIKSKNSNKFILIRGVTGQLYMILSAVIVRFITIPLGIKYFGYELFGIWFILSSLAAYLNLSNFGLGGATITLLSQSKSKEDCKKIIWTSIRLLSIISVFFACLIIMLHYYDPTWMVRFLNVDFRINMVSKTITAFLLLTALRIPTRVFISSFAGYQKVAWQKIYRSFQSYSPLIAILVVIVLRGSLYEMALIEGTLNLLFGIIAGMHLFKEFPYLLDINTDTRKSLIKDSHILKTSITFFALTLYGVLILRTDNLIISRFLGVKAVASYAITFTFFRMIQRLINSIHSASWPIYGKLFGKKDWHTIEKYYKQFSLLSFCLGGIFWILSIAYAEPIIKSWAGTEAYAGNIASFFLGGYLFLACFAAGNNTLINGMNPTKSIVLVKFIEGSIKLTLSITLIGFLNYRGLAIASFISMAAMTTWYNPFYIRKRTGYALNTIDASIVKGGILVIIAVLIMAIIKISISGKQIVLYVSSVMLSVCLFTYFYNQATLTKSSLLKIIRYIRN